MPIHSPTNDTMAIFWPFGNKWSLYDPIENKYIIENIIDGSCHLLAFHPKNPDLLGLLTKDGFVKLYDSKKQITIAQTETSLGTTKPGDPFNTQMIDFSKDGKHISVIVNGKCFVLNADQDN